MVERNLKTMLQALSSSGEIKSIMVKSQWKNITKMHQTDMKRGLALPVASGREILSIGKTIYSNSAICTKPGEPFRFARFLVKL